MKKILTIIMTAMLMLSLIPGNMIYALTEDELIKRELQLAIVSGDGTSEFPYEVDYSKAPLFKEHMDTLNDGVMSVLKGEVNNINSKGIYDGILSGTTYTNQTNGGEWVYTSGAPSVSSNDRIWMKKIVYVSKTNTKAIYELMKNDKFADVKALKSTLANSAYTTALSALSAKIGATAAKAVLVSLGKINGLFSVAEILKFVNDYFVESRYKSAANNNYGMINATFQTSYNGSWYSQYGEDTWTNANTVHLPGSYYGTGTYKSY